MNHDNNKTSTAIRYTALARLVPPAGITRLRILFETGDVLEIFKPVWQILARNENYQRVPYRQMLHLLDQAPTEPTFDESSLRQEPTGREDAVTALYKHVAQLQASLRAHRSQAWDWWTQLAARASPRWLEHAISRLAHIAQRHHALFPIAPFKPDVLELLRRALEVAPDNNLDAALDLVRSTLLPNH